MEALQLLFAQRRRLLAQFFYLLKGEVVMLHIVFITRRTRFDPCKKKGLG